AVLVPADCASTSRTASGAGGVVRKLLPDRPWRSSRTGERNSLELALGPDIREEGACLLHDIRRQLALEELRHVREEPLELVRGEADLGEAIQQLRAAASKDLAQRMAHRAQDSPAGCFLGRLGGGHQVARVGNGRY